MRSTDILTDAFTRVGDGVARLLDGLDDDALVWRPDPQANTVAWLVWHIGRGIDAQVAEVAGTDEVWTSGGWARRFALPFDDAATGYGQSPAQVGSVRVTGELLRGYVDATQDATLAYVAALADDDLDRVVDERWDPPVTLGVRLVSVVGDATQHLGQASYVTGLWRRASR